MLTCAIKATNKTPESLNIIDLSCLYSFQPACFFGHECEVSAGAQVTFAQRWGVAPGATG